jgi:hypothetical protein
VKAPELLAAPLLIAFACAAADDLPQTAVTVEVFTVALAGADDARLVFTRSDGPLLGGVNPDQHARELASEATGELRLIHSTSWRWEPDGRIVLTYVAWAGDGGLAAGARPLPALTPPGPTDPLNPRPPEIAELDPLAHGLRHLAFLLRTSTDGVVAGALGMRACRVLEQLEPEVAGELP